MIAPEDDSAPGDQEKGNGLLRKESAGGYGDRLQEETNSSSFIDLT